MKTVNATIIPVTVGNFPYSVLKCRLRGKSMLRVLFVWLSSTTLWPRCPHYETPYKSHAITIHIIIRPLNSSALADLAVNQIAESGRKQIQLPLLPRFYFVSQKSFKYFLQKTVLIYSLTKVDKQTARHKEGRNTVIIQYVLHCPTERSDNWQPS